MRTPQGGGLPAQWTPFVGRELELCELRRVFVDGTRLVTLTGTGGVGKTRLALRVVEDLRDVFAEDVQIVELGGLNDAALVPLVVAQELGARELPAHDALEVLIERLRGQRVLLVLDNCEHLRDACATLVFDLLRSCPGVSILATSREPLGVPGEVTWRVPSLAIPDAAVTAGTDEIAAAESARLLVARARAVKADFVLTDANAPSIAQICKRLDGIPLAIELAAARLNALTPAEIARRLDDCFSVLGTGSQLTVRRHQTLRAAIDWSYGLLSDAERAIWQRLSVFTGGWTLDAAAAVCGERNVLDVLATLADKSLVQVDEHAGASRYRLLEALRQYAGERMHQTGEAESVRRRHADFYLDLAQRAEPRLRGPEQRTWLDRLDQEHDNLRAALRWSIDQGEGTTALLLSGALGFFWVVRGHRREGLRWLDAALALRERATLAAQAKATSWAGYLAAEVSENERAVPMYEASLQLRRELGDVRGMARVLEQYGHLERRRGNYERAATLLEQSLTLRREQGDRHGIAASLDCLGRVASSTGDFTRAEGLHQQALALFEEVGDLHEAAHTRTFLSHAVAGLGQTRRAIELTQRAAEFFKSMGDNDGLAASLNQLARLSLESHDAVAMCRESLRLFHELGAPWGAVPCLETAALLIVQHDHPADVVRLFEAAAMLREVFDLPLAPALRPEQDLALSSAGDRLSTEDLEAARRGGRELSLDDAVALATRLLADLTFRPEVGTLDEPKHNLPAQVSRFIGRGREIDELERLLAEDRRVLTLTGAGGMGKTRLALRLAERLVGAYPDGVWLVELAGHLDATLLPHVVATAIGVREREGESVLDSLVKALRPGRLLLVLDNCEHILGACAELVDRLVHDCPSLAVVLTSRQPLAIAGEVVWRVPPLLLPRVEAAQGSDEIGASESVQLFVDRAQAVVPSFVLTDANATVIGQICQRLDGIPLAIELAAARVEALGLRQIADRLDDSLALLTRGSRTAPRRNQTLRGALEFSYELLSDAERVLFRRLAVFTGGWPLEAAEAICGPGNVLDGLAELVSRSLVIVDHHDSEARYRLLEVVRQYAAELLRESGEDEVVRAHHLDWYRQLAERSSATLRGPDQTLWLSVLERELGNLRAAGRWALESGAAEAALQLGGACGYFCQIRGHLFRSEARGMLDQALARCSELPTPPAVDVRARALYWAGTFAMEQFDYPRAAEALEESLRQWRELEDHAQVAEALIGLGALARARGDFERSEVMLTEAMTLARTHAAPTSLGRALRFMGAIARERGEARRAADLDRESIEVFRTTGESHQVGHVLDQLGEALLDLTEYDAALQAHLESVPLLRAAGCEEGVNSSIYHQARLAWARGDAQTALALAVDSLGVYQRLGVRRDVAGCLDLVAQLCSKQMPDRSARLFGAAEALRQELVVSLAPADRAARDATVRALRALLGTEFARHYEDGEALPLDRAVDEALAVQLSAAAAEASGEPQAASGDMLSAREREVAELIAEGLTNREIADRLVIAPRTAEAHVTHLLNKLGLRSRSQVAVWVVNHSRPR